MELFFSKGGWVALGQLGFSFDFCVFFSMLIFSVRPLKPNEAEKNPIIRIKNPTLPKKNPNLLRKTQLKIGSEDTHNSNKKPNLAEKNPILLRKTQFYIINDPYRGSIGGL